MAVENFNPEVIFAKRQGLFSIYLFNTMGGKGNGGSNWIAKDMTSFMRPPLMSWVTGKESFEDSVRNSGGAAEQAINKFILGEKPKPDVYDFTGGGGGGGVFSQMTSLTQSMQNDAIRAAQEAAEARYAAQRAQESAKEEEDMIGQDKIMFDRQKSLAEQRLKQLQDLQKSKTSTEKAKTQSSSIVKTSGSPSSTTLLNVQKPLVNVDALYRTETFDENQPLNQLIPPSGSSVRLGGN